MMCKICLRIDIKSTSLPSHDLSSTGGREPKISQEKKEYKTVAIIRNRDRCDGALSTTICPVGNEASILEMHPAAAV